MTADRWTPSDTNCLVGVIDLLDGRAVHAIAGERDDYRPIRFCDGNPQSLAQHYFTVGVTALYVADLSSIRQHTLQSDLVCALVETGVPIWLDLGWDGHGNKRSSEVFHAVGSLAKFSNTRFIAATESCRDTNALSKLADVAGHQRTYLGLDYRSGELLSVVPEERTWLESANETNIAGCVILDLAAVGTQQGPATEQICKRVHKTAPELKLVSGGGVRSPEDAKALQAAGCDHILVATALFP
ncbi:MAG: HisA/HisF-related TIM barrel protein [Planctomycetota bacterium]